jgi:flagellar basal body-associated protein FliL
MLREPRSARPSEMLSNNQAVILLLSLNSVPLGFVAYSTAHPRAVAAEAQPRKADVVKTLPVLKLDEVVLQLAFSPGSERPRYLAINLDLELDAETSRPLVARYVPRLREAILTYFSDRTATQLEIAGALEMLKEDLRVRMNRAMAANHIHGLFVTQFIIQ